MPNACFHFQDLALVEQDSDSEDTSNSDSDDSSEESIQGEITEKNLRLGPKCKNKPNIEVINHNECFAEKCIEKDHSFEDG